MSAAPMRLPARPIEAAARARFNEASRQWPGIGGPPSWDDQTDENKEKDCKTALAAISAFLREWL